MKEDKKHTIPTESAQEGAGIEPKKEATVGKSPTGGKDGLDAEGKRDRDAEFEALIENEYKEQFGKKVQKIISKRLREVKTVKEENAKITEQQKDEIIKMLVIENRILKAKHNEEKHSEEKKSRAAALRKEAEETKKVYPWFDFETEIKNPEFVRLLKVGVSVKNAYEVVNIDSILEKSSKNAEKKVVDSIRAKASRPAENGSEGGSGILLSGNASKLTKKERADLARRAAKGEKISF